MASAEENTWPQASRDAEEHAHRGRYLRCHRPARRGAKLLEKAWRTSKTSSPPVTPTLLRACTTWPTFDAAIGRHVDALKLHDETLSLRQQKFVPDHPDTLKSMSRLAWLLATVPDPKLRDPARAVGLAKRPVDLSPNKAEFRGALGERTTAGVTGKEPSPIWKKRSTCGRLTTPEEPTTVSSWPWPTGSMAKRTRPGSGSQRP